MMEILLEQETKLNTIAALSTIAVAKTDNTKNVASQYVQTDIAKGTGDDDGMKNFSIAAAFNNLPPCNPVNISFKDIKYTVRKPFSKTEKEILHNVNGTFPSGSLIAIMGPSGAGKSTLLNALSGYTQKGVSGAMYVNGRIKDLKDFKKSTSYITQDDRLQLLLTVIENMRIAADLKLGGSVSRVEKNKRIENILSALGLYDHQFTMTDRLSGGQRKRLSVALELINNPTVLWLDEPTTGLDSYSCTQMIALLKQLAKHGRTVICTIHQPSAKLFESFDLVYILALGNCLYQGHSSKLVPFLQSCNLSCPKFHNPADFAIELASGEYGMDKIKLLSHSIHNGENVQWFEYPHRVMKMEQLRNRHPLTDESVENNEVSETYQLKVLLKRGVIKSKRDQTLTHLRIGVNIGVAALLGWVYFGSGNEGDRVIDNYNLLFTILMHHMMSTMMLTILTFPTEKHTILKETFNRWYTIKSYYYSLMIVDFPLSLLSCALFSVIIYYMTGWPVELVRCSIFFVISLLTVLIASTSGLIIGTCFNVINGTFIGPVHAVPMMMFAGFGVTIRDLPFYLKWGSYISYLKYGLEGFVGALFYNRKQLECNAMYCHYKYPAKFLKEIDMQADQYSYDIVALLIILLVLRVLAYFILKWQVVLKR